MKIRCAISSWLLVLCLLSLGAWSQPTASAPVVRKVEPPTWWANLTPDLTLLVTGENLANARVESATQGLAVAGSNPSANGHYVFIQLKLSASLRPGTAQLHINSASGTATVSLPILTRSDPRGHYQGVSPDDVIYLIMPDRFANGDASNDQPTGSTGIYDRSKQQAYHGGDIRGVREHLPYLHDLGVTAIWLTPIWKSTDSDYHGYHVVDFYAVDERFGSMQEYQELIADAHKLGIKVMHDYVANHTGPNHPWVKDPPTPTWFHGSPAHHLQPSYDFSGIVDPHAAPLESRNTLEGWFVDKLPDLNPDDPQLGLYLAQNAIWWTEMTQLDAFRLDTFPYSSRRFWSAWHARLRQVYPQITSVGEVADKNPVVTSFFEGGRKQWDGIDSGATTVFDFPLYEAIRDVVIRGKPMQQLINVFEDDSLYLHPGGLVTFIGNHDKKRFLGEDGSNVEQLKAAFGLQLTMRGIPQIYSGDEIAMTGGEDPDNRRDFPGGFPGDLQNAFTPAGRTPEQKNVFDYVKSLLQLRQSHAALRQGSHHHIGWGENYYAFVRETGSEKVLIIFNNATSAQQIKLPVSDTSLGNARELTPIFGTVNATLKDGKLEATLPAKALDIYSVH